MGGWYILAGGVGCAWGVLLFLGLVADQVQVLDQTLCRFEHQQKKAYEKRLAGEEDQTQEAA